MDKRVIANLAVKKNLSDALFAILEKKGLGSVSVSELVERSGVSRSSFYRNFDSIDDVLAYGNSLLEDKYYDTCPYEAVDFTDIGCVTWHLGFWKRHAPQIVVLANSGIAHITFGKMFEISMRGNVDDRSDMICKQRFALGAFYAIALNWIESGSPCKKEDLARQFCTLLTQGILTDC